MSRYLALDAEQGKIYLASANVRGSAVKIEKAIVLSDLGPSSSREGSADAVTLTINNAAEIGKRLKEAMREAGIAAGPVGREAAASTNPRLDAGILSYSRSKGVFIGAALKGAVISPDNDLNEAIYNKKANELLKSPPMPIGQMPPSVRIFPRTLVRYSIR